MDRDEQNKIWAAKEFGIPIADILWFNSGICYDRIGVTTQESANKITEKVKDKTANGGMFDGMPLGGQSFYSPTKNQAIKQEYYDIMC